MIVELEEVDWKIIEENPFLKVKTQKSSVKVNEFVPREFPLHLVCSWLGNSPRIAQQSYLLVTQDDFANAAGLTKMVVEE